MVLVCLGVRLGGGGAVGAASGWGRFGRWHGGMRGPLGGVFVVVLKGSMRITHKHPWGCTDLLHSGPM